MKITRICLLLATLYLLALLSWNASAAETVTGGTINDAISWNFQNGTLSISGEGSMGFRPSQQSPWYHLREAITTVVVEEGVTVIGDNAFKNCIHLVQVQLPSTLKSIQKNAFFNCQSLSEIRLPPNVTYIGEHAFRYCISLKTITIPDSVETMEGSVFQNCSSLETVILSEKLEEIRPYTFHGCSSLTAITLPQGMRKIGACAFKNCEGLTEVTFSGKLWYVDTGAFSGCTGLTYLEFPAGSLYLLDDAFRNCDHLMEIRFLGDPPSLGEAVFDSRENGEPPCVIRYPSDNDNWTERIMQRWEAVYGGAIRLASDGIVPCDHVKTAMPGKSATCTEAGLTEGAYCNLCGEVLKKQETIDALGHDPVTVTVPPTCTEVGYDLHTCSRCGEATRNNEIAALGHAFGEWETVIEPTVETAGLALRECAYCLLSEQRQLEKLPPQPTEPPTQKPTAPVATPSETVCVPAQTMPPKPRERMEAGLQILLVLLAVAGAIVAVKCLTRKKL